MAHREFIDAQGARWDVWDVHPTVARDTLARLYPQPAPTRESRADVATNLADGWLCFERQGERRRLAPIPPGWADLPPTALVGLCNRAARVSRPGAADRDTDELRR